MGEVVDFLINRCTCGWAYPAKLQIATDEPVTGGYFIRITCPDCGEVTETAERTDIPNEEDPSDDEGAEILPFKAR